MTLSDKRARAAEQVAQADPQATLSQIQAKADNIVAAFDEWLAGKPPQVVPPPTEKPA